MSCVKLRARLFSSGRDAISFAEGLTCGRSGITVTEGIASVSLGTGAHGHVIVHGAQGGDAAGAQAGIPALFVAAGEIHRAIGIHAAFGTAIRRRASVGGRAGAGGRAVNVPALGVHTARRRCARVSGRYGVIRQRRF